MDVKAVVHQYIDTMDFSDEDALRSEYFLSASRHNVFRLLYYRPDMADIILKDQAIETMEAQRKNGNFNLASYFTQIIEHFNHAKAMSKEELRFRIIASYVSLSITSTLMEEVEHRGPQCLRNLANEAKEDPLLSKIPFMEAWKDAEFFDFVQEFPLSITEFEPDEFVDYGDKETPMSSAQWEEIRRKIETMKKMENDNSNRQARFLEEDLRTQEQRIENFANDMVKHIEKTKTKHTANTYFPFDFYVKDIRWFIDHDSLGLDEQHLDRLIDRIYQITVPGFDFTVKCIKEPLGLLTEIKINHFSDTKKN